MHELVENRYKFLAFFFFQAEDGIRDLTVTGVQTCALPIFKPGHGFVDYLLYVDRKAAGVVEAKPAGTTLTGVEIQGDRYARGLPDELPAHLRPLPFMYLSTGTETTFANLLDPDPRSRRVFCFQRPETLAGWLAAEPL